MKKPTILRIVVLTLFFLQSFITYSQNLVAFVPGSDKDLVEDIFRKEKNVGIAEKSVSSKEKSTTVGFMVEDENPINKYAQLPYAGVVSQCPNNGKDLPKLFLCGGNDSRAIKVEIPNTISVTWQKFVSGGGCATVGNSDCANEAAAENCWVTVVTGVTGANGNEYLANTAGQFRVKIVDNTATPKTFYFNVYQNTLIPAATTKSDIITYGTCSINGEISVNGFGAGYQYSFTTTGTSGSWQDSNVFTVGTPGIYTAFIRIKGVVGSCEFKVINLEIKSTTFAIATAVTSPKCSQDKGSVKITPNNVSQSYTYKIFKVNNNNSTTLINTLFSKPSVTEYAFNGLDAGTYKVVTYVTGSTCPQDIVDTKTVSIANAPTALSATINETKLTSCSPGVLEIKNVAGGVAPYKYWSKLTGSQFVLNANNRIIVSQSGNYVVRIEDANGCFLDMPYTVKAVDKPSYTIGKTDGKCGEKTGVIKIEVTALNGYTVEYSINGGTPISSYNSFSGLAAGNYIVKVQYKKSDVNGGNFCFDPTETITIGASTALTASAGVAELSGCGPAGNEKQGKVRITNAQGGVAPYKYKFNGGWIDDNFAYINPGGPYTFYVKDALGCEYAMGGIILTEKPGDPKITVDAPVFNCDGTATSTVRVLNTGTGNFSYNYYIDAVPNTPINSNVFTNVSQGDHTITVTYTVNTIPTYSNLLKEDFGSGDDTTSPGINTTYYCFEKQIDGKDCWGFASNSLNDGEYTVTAKLVAPHGTWLNPVDHTTITGIKDTKGRYLAVNIGDKIPTSAILYQKEIKDIIPGQPISVKIAAINLLKSTSGGADPDIQLALIDKNGNDVSSVSTGLIPKSDKWEDYLLTLNPGSNDKLTFVIRSNVQQISGNDVAVDDVTVYQLPITCGATTSFPIVVDGSKAFSAGITGYKDIQCAGEQNGEITISAKNFDPVKGFQYSMDGGLNWEPAVIPNPASTSGSITLKNLASRVYDISIRYDSSANSCIFPVKQEIKMPEVLKITAKVTKEATCIFGATITAEATGGTPGYKYQLIAADGITIIKPFQASGEFSNVPVGSYIVVAIDLNLCPVAVPAEVDVAAATAPTAIFEPSDLCFGTSAAIKIKVTGGVGPYTYKVSFDGGTLSDPSATFDGPNFTYTANTTGTYTFEVTDSYGCKAAVISQVINAKLTANIDSITELNCDPAKDAVITATIVGGTAPFVIRKIAGTGPGTLLQPSPAETGRTFTYSTAIASNYEFEIKDFNGCIVILKPTVNAITNPTVVASPTAPKCIGNANGEVELVGSGGSPVYNYKFAESTAFAGSTFTTTTIYKDLKAGISYSYQVKDSKGCVSAVKTITLTDPTAITATVEATELGCSSTGTKEAIVTIKDASGGAGGYTFSFNGNTNYTPENTFSTNVGGKVTAYIKDKNGCEVRLPDVIIKSLSGPTSIAVLFDSGLECPDYTAHVKIQAIGGLASIKYQIIAPLSAVTSPDTNGEFKGLAPGTYTFKATDRNGCSVTLDHIVKSVPDITAIGSVTSPIKCFGDSNGSIRFTISGVKTKNYDYIVLNTAKIKVAFGNNQSALIIDLNDLPASNYTITVIDRETKCPATYEVKLTQPAVLVLDPTGLTDVTCKAGGTATINAKGGWGTYSYVVTGPAPAVTVVPASTPKNTFVNLVAGDYSFTVTDLNGCHIAGTFTIKDKVLPTASIDPSSVYCISGVGGTLKVTPNTQTNYTYTLGSIVQSHGTFSGLIPGKYTIRVTDTSTGCFIDLDKETIAQPMSASTKLLADLDCDVTPASPDASIEITISNGYPDYTYKVNTTGAPFSGTVYTVGAGENVFTYPAAAAGMYYFEITDSKGCTIVVSKKIDILVLPTATTRPTNPTCYNGTNGSITIDASLGFAPYSYEVSTNGGVDYSLMDSNVYSGASADINYWFRVTDSKKCQFVTKRTLINPSELTAKADVTTTLTCGAGNVSQAATITVTIDKPGTPFTGGKYKYDYGDGKGFVNSNTYTTNNRGLVSITVKDANNCTVTVSTTVLALDPPTNMAFDAPALITCETDHDKTALTVKVKNGVPPFKFEITSTDTAVTPTPLPVATGINTQDYTFTDLAPGTYYFKVTDANKCTTVGSYKIDAAVPVQVEGLPVANVSCNAGTDGSIKFTVTNNATVGTIVPVLTKGGLAVAPTPTLTVTGSVYVYTGLTQGTYIFTATNDITKCFATSTVSISEPAAIIGLAATATKVYSCMPLPKTTTIKVTATGGASPLYYAVVKFGEPIPVFPTDYNTTGIFTKDTGIDGLVYDAYVVDKNGKCPQKLTPVITVEDNEAPTVKMPAAQCYSGSALTITMEGTVFAGSSIQYGINGVYTTDPIKNITSAGDYNLTVKDDNGCISPVKVYKVIDQLTIGAILNKDITCSIPEAAQITLSAGGGVITDYTYEYKIGLGGTYAALPTVPGNVLNPTVAGDYYFQVTSGGCSAETIVPVKVTDPAIPTATAVATDPKCNNVSEGTITITASGGIPGYQYRINGGAWQDSPVFTDLAGAVAPGTLYSYQVKDDKGCVSIAKDIAVSQPSPIIVKKTIVGITCVSTTGVSLGSITIDKVTGGTSDYNYYVTGKNYKKEFTNVPGTAAVFEIVDFGIYEIRITDANGCVFTEEVTITSPPDDLDITVTAPPVADCTALGSAVVAVGGTLSTIPIGNGPFFFSYYTGVKPVYPTTGVWYSESPAKQATIPGLIPGIRYTFIVYDSKSGCYYYETATMPIPSNSTLTVGAPTVQNITCKGSKDGKVTFNVTSTYAVDTPITYEVYDALSLAPTGIKGSGIVPANKTLIISGFGAMPYGDYFVLVKEDVGATNAGCSKSTALFSIRESAVLLAVDFAIVKNDNCKTDAGIIKVIGKDGTGPYKYMVTTTPGTPLATDTRWVTSPIFNKESGNYYAWVKDDFGCIKGTPVFLLPLDLEPVFALSVPNKCATEGNFVVDVIIKDTTIAVPPALPTPSMAPFSVSVNGGAFQSFTGLTYSATGLKSGEQTIIIQDKNGCPIEHKIMINATPLATADVTKVLNCSGTPNAIVAATITVTIKKGTAPYTYEVKKGLGGYTTINPIINVVAGVTTFDYKVANVDADTYQFKITDNNTCPVVTNAVVIDPIIPIVPAFNAIKPLCNGGTGTIELSATGGSGSYTYDFNNSGAFINQTIYAVKAGTYSFIVKDALGCEESGSVVLGEPSEVVLGIPKISPLTCGPGNIGQAATVDLTTGASGGTGAYLYSFDGSAFTNKAIYTVEDNDSERDIPFAIQDENGCEVVGSVKILKLNPPTKFDLTPSAVITCTTGKIDITISKVINAVGPLTTGLTYQIISSTSLSLPRNNGPDPIFTDLLPGDYVFQVTDAVTNCVKQLPYEINDVTKINIVKQSTTDITCSTATDGKASFFVSGFATGVQYYYKVDGVAVTGNHTASTIDLTDLAAGPHTIEVFDNATDCSKLINFDIFAPTALILDPLDVTPLGCATDGAVTITAQGGWGNNVYTLTPPSGPTIVNNDGIFGNLRLDGHYDVSVKDANGCVVTGSFDLAIPTPPTATITTTSDYCYDSTNKATLVVKASLGVAPYLFSIDNGISFLPSNTLAGADDTYTFSNLSPGSYDVFVKDAYGCQSLASVKADIKPQLFAKAENKKDIFCTVGDENGTIKITALDGYGSYTYTVKKDTDPTSAPIGFPVGSDTADYTVTGAGSYVFVIYDLKGCSYTVAGAIVMADPTPVKFITTPTSPSCAGTQGELSDGSILVTLDPASINNPDYTYTIVSDPAGYTKTQVNNGLFTGLTAGTYDVTVTSARDCSDTKQEIITAPVVLEAKASVEPFGCSIDNTPKDAVVTVTVTPGTGTADYTYSFNGGNFDITSSFAVSTPQTVTYIVLDKNGCRFDGSVVVDAFTPPIDMTIVATPIYCKTANSESTVTVTEVILTGGVIGTGTYTYEIIAPIGVAIPNTTGVFDNLLAGIYQIKVTDATGCSKVKSINIEKSTEISVAKQLLSNVLCKGDATGSIAFTVSNYILPADYSYGITTMPAGAAPIKGQMLDVISYTGLIKGDYTFTVTDNISGCEEVVNFSIAEPADVLDFTAVATNINCTKKNATITFSATGGTESYGYAVVKKGALAPTVFSSNKVLEVDTNNGSDMDWVVYVQDANGCAVDKPQTILLDVSPIINKVVATQCPSLTGTYSITVTASGFNANLEYSLDGSTWGTNNILEVGAPGNYTVHVRDENKCPAVTVSVFINDQLQLRYDLTTRPTCLDANGVVTLEAFGGTGISANYEYSNDGIGYSSAVGANVFGGLAPSITPYRFYARDIGTSCVTTVDVIIEVPNKAIAFTLIPKNAICNGDSNGSITVNMDTPTTTVNNNPVYTYAINPNLGTLVGNVFTNLPKGTYTVTVTSGKGCPVDKVETVGEPDLIVVAAPTVAPYGCTTANVTNNATITVALPTGGSGTYKVYEFLRNGNPIAVQRGDNPIYTETDLLGGNYVINVFDSKGCLGTSTAVIKPFLGIDFDATSAVMVTKAITCIDKEDIQVNVTFTGGVPVPLDYKIVATVDDATLGTVGNAIPYATQTNNSGEFKDLTVGSYSITVTNPITGCSIKTIHYVNEPNTFNLVASNVKNVICFGTATGSVDLTFVDNLVPSDDAGVFEYTITGPAGTSPLLTSLGTVVTITDLVSGLYIVKAKLVATPTCEVETTFTIAQPSTELKMYVTPTPISCDPANDGTISVRADGGWPGDYQYKLDGPISVAYSDQFFFENLIPGTYTVSVKDSNGCEKSEDVILKNPDPIVVTANATANMLDCNGGTSGEIVVDLPTGGQGSNYSYILNYVSADPVFSSEPQSSPVFSGLGAGTYTVTVIDGLNCISQPTANIVIDEPTKVEASLVLATGITCKTEATLTLTATGGTGTYEYSSDQDFANVIGSLPATFSVGLGDHQYYVRDTKGCVSYISNNVTINELTPLTVEVDESNAVIYCKGDVSGIIDASAFGSLGNYIFSLEDTLGNIIRPDQFDGRFEKLPKGQYIVKVRSGIDCAVASKVIDIKEPATAIQAIATLTNVTCFGENNGKIEITASGGTGKISYAISPNLNQFFEGNVSGGHVFNNLKPGEYDILSSDENGCFILDKKITITEPNAIAASVVAGSMLPEVCAGDKDGEFDITVSGGTAPYSVSLDKLNGTYTQGGVGQTEFTFDKLSGGTHIVYIKDAAGCIYELEVIMPDAVTINPQAVVDYTCVSNAAANSVTVLVDASITNPADVYYALDGGASQFSNVFTNLTPGMHTITVTHINGCVKDTTPFEIEAIAPLELVLSDGGLNEIVATATGGGGAYQYSLNGESYGTSNNFIIYKSGNYTVTVTDKNGCTATATRYFEYIDVCIPNHFTPNGDGVNDEWGPGCTINYKNLEYIIFDRYGRQLAKYNLGQKWNGKYNGAELPSGDYWYILKLNDPRDNREFVGHFTLYR
jgi:gliding motility-associated-like protein